MMDSRYYRDAKGFLRNKQGNTLVGLGPEFDDTYREGAGERYHMEKAERQKRIYKYTKLAKMQLSLGE